MKLNEDKCHLLVGGYKHETIWAKIGDTRIWESNKQKLLGYIEIEHYPLMNTFQTNVKKAGRKLCFSKVVKLYDPNTKEKPNEIFH